MLMTHCKIEMTFFFILFYDFPEGIKNPTPAPTGPWVPLLIIFSVRQPTVATVSKGSFKVSKKLLYIITKCPANRECGLSSLLRSNCEEKK